MSLVWKNLTGLHRALTSTPSNMFGMNWCRDCEPGLLAQHQCLTSQMLKNSHRNTPKSCGKTFQISGSCYSHKEGTNCMLMSVYLECDVIKKRESWPCLQINNLSIHTRIEIQIHISFLHAFITASMESCGTDVINVGCLSALCLYIW